MSKLGGQINSLMKEGNYERERDNKRGGELSSLAVANLLHDADSARKEKVWMYNSVWLIVYWHCQTSRKESRNKEVGRRLLACAKVDGRPIFCVNALVQLRIKEEESRCQPIAIMCLAGGGMDLLYVD